MSKTGLIAVVGTVSALSVGAVTFLAFRANQTPTPQIRDFEASSPAAAAPKEVAAPVEVDRAPAVREAAPRVPQQQPVRSQPDQRASEVTDSPARPAALPPPSDPVAAPPVATPPPSQTVEPPATTAAATAGATTTEPPPVQDAPKSRFEEVTVKADSVVGIKIDQTISSETARLEDRVTAKVTRDVSVDGRTAIAAGTKLEGVVTQVERGGKFKERARLAIQFHTLVLADGLRVPIKTEAILREGDSPSGAAGSKISGAAVAGAIIGGLIGGKRGAVIGTTAGAAGGTAVVASGNRNEALIQSGAPLTVRLTAPVAITIEREYEVR